MVKKTVKLDKKLHDRKGFDCGIDALNNYLKVMANQQSSKDSARTFVLEDKDKPEKIVGYYTLTMNSLDFKKLPTKLQNKHKNADVGGLIARLAIDNHYKGKGIGRWLLLDALKRFLLASEGTGFPLVTVDAKEGAIQFYEKYGFTAFQDIPEKLFITIAEIRLYFPNES
jgi:GNAT superfamily N-acetyltransferase